MLWLKMVELVWDENPMLGTMNQQYCCGKDLYECDVIRMDEYGLPGPLMSPKNGSYDI